MITNLHVERLGPDLLVTWRGGDDPTVFVSVSPEDAGTLVVPVTRPGGVIVSGLPTDARPYVHVLDLDGEFVVGAPRLVELEGTRNFRDLGGYRTADGRQVAWGRLYRSDALDRLSAADLDRLTGLGVRLVCDLRGVAEARPLPDRIPPGVRSRSLPMGDGDADHGDLVERVRTGELDGVDEAFVGTIYASLLERFAAHVGDLVTEAADPSNHALVFHCAAGKDRTGLVAAMILEVLGVADADILDDYELTNRYRSSHRVAELRPELAERGVDIDRLLPYYTAPRAVLVATLGLLRSQHGSIEGYLTGPGAVAPQRIEELRRTLLVG